MWGDSTLAAGEEVTHSFGHLRMRLRRQAEEIWLHTFHDDGSDGSAQSGAPGRDSDAWIRWAVPAGDAIHLQPALPDRLVVVSPERPFYLPPEGRARIFVRIPLFARVQVGGEGRITLGEFASVVLSDTWWGTFTDGELGYWLGTRARRIVDSSLYEPHLAICPFVLVNESDSVLPVEHFAVRVAYLTLFGRGKAVWTDEVQVRYRGGAEGSEIRYTGRKPDDAGDLDHLASSRERAPRGFHARTFGRLVAKVAAL